MYPRGALVLASFNLPIDLRCYAGGCYIIEEGVITFLERPC